MQIREASEADRAALAALHHAAFGAEGAIVAELALALLDDPSAQPLVALVAETSAGIIGSAIFSAARINGAERLAAAILSPLAVAPAYQRRGVGRTLIEHGISRLREAGVDLVFVLGNPRYYGRYGFRAQHAVSAPYQLAHPDAWMALALRPAALTAASGVLRCADALHKPELW
ncbi:N-acetyltransferase [Chloroflexus sp.]|uniref:GNAT family N-acetyltransferase n=1 Tax=Chloroflexus sp. TaxID=1904827 RepID=UPI00298F26FF|nr:N-acetyltransferase [Chloroflexus sp.]MDW8405915.1 N-acetyltransferase [Chloroflexus sp.]